MKGNVATAIRSCVLLLFKPSECVKFVEEGCDAVCLCRGRQCELRVEDGCIWSRIGFSTNLQPKNADR